MPITFAAVPSEYAALSLRTPNSELLTSHSHNSPFPTPNPSHPVLFSYFPMPKASRLECSICKLRFDAGTVQNLCSCGGPLLVRYDLDTLRIKWRRRDVPNGPAT